ncbi:hypothetical protein [Hymenobacter convexus]|uniref:hypothetical protein n=1 Tax=Hymenobacter sp. CA1UV-4 TaxID=3063782 RepID=UPI0027139955|nr:hypothetical protein [Hymenobacter sp. CA1UV-4]MDO7851520.1 hypothetical protein [Hymenobacter sp. CA1UV-4]
MEKSFRSLALACTAIGLLAAACQPQAKPHAVAHSRPETKAGIAANAQPATAAHLPVVTHLGPDEASAEDRTRVEIGAPVPNISAFLTANNLAPLWQADFGQRENDYPRPTVLDGFYGAEHRHIAFIFDSVEPDTAQVGAFRVRGRSRFRKSITPFAGAITVVGIRSMKAFLDLDSAEVAQARSYTATARFVLHEDSTATGAGTFQGTAHLDFYRLGTGKLDLLQTFPDKAFPSGGGGLLFRGQWRSRRTGRQQAVAFANYSQSVVPDAMSDLYLGDRGENINPKYAGLDWSEAWENEEWWAKSPKPSLNL